MTDSEMTFIAKSLRSLQKDVNHLTDSVKKLDKRIKALEPQNPDEMIVRNAKGELDLYLIKDEEGNYIEYPTD